MSKENPQWGASRIHGELLMLGFEVAQSTVSKYMVRGGTSPSQNWKTFLRNHAQTIAAIDLCVVPTLTFDRLFAFLVLGHGRRQLLRFEVTWHPTAEWLARQITEAFPWASAPAYLVRDNDGAYGHVFTSRVRAMGIRDRPISPGSPWQNGYEERSTVALLSRPFSTSRLSSKGGVHAIGARRLQAGRASYGEADGLTRSPFCPPEKTRVTGPPGSFLCLPRPIRACPGYLSAQLEKLPRRSRSLSTPAIACRRGEREE
jgi:hypothetical protein